MSRPSGVDRRTFLGVAGAAAGIAAAAAIAPLPARAAGLYVRRPVVALDHGQELPGGESSAADDWDVDDMCGHAPRYAHPIPYSPPRGSPVAWEQVDPIDLMLVS